VDEVEVDDETPKPWDRQPGEPNNWYRRFLSYRDMPHSNPPLPRTLLGTANHEQVCKGSKKYNGTPQSWRDAFKKWNWRERAEGYDAHLQREREAVAAVERARVLTSGYALMHERVKTLNVLAKKLVADIASGKMYRQDVRSIGTGKEARQVDVELFDEGVIRELRACLADIAAELGERVKKTETAITQLPGSIYVGVNPDDLGSEP